MRLFAVAVLLAIPVPAVAQDPPPDARWHQIDDRAVRVVFHDGLEPVARKVAASANRALEEFAGFGDRPSETIHILVTDHMDISNGFARSVPFPRIVIWARPPIGGLGSIPFADWIDLLVTHEVAHVLHGEMTSPLGRLGRTLLGRASLLWPLFPAYVLPTWAIEGVAVQAETAVAGEGRIHGTRLESVARAAALDGSLETVDQVLGKTGVFPGGDRSYIYGGLFHEHLTRRFGSAAVADWFRRSAERLNPYWLDASARDVFGESLAALHEDWREGVIAEARERQRAVADRALAPEPELLTRDARTAVFPRVHPDTGERVHAESDGGRAPSLVTDDGRRLGPLHLVAAPAPLPGGGWLIPQPEYVDRYRVRNDLWVFESDGFRRLTKGARITTADVRLRDGTIVGVIESDGTHRMVLLDPDGQEQRELAGADPEVLWSHPRWSPDGERIAVLRWRTGGIRQIVVLDGGERAIVAQGRAPMTGPAWSPDGRWLVWTSERTGVSNLYAAEIPGSGARERTGPVRQLSDLLTDAAFPEVDLDGRVLFSLVRGSGWELAALPFRPERGFDPRPTDPRFDLPAGVHPSSTPAAEVHPWSSWPTLRPRHVLPIASEGQSIRNGDGELIPAVSPTIGLSSSATDLVGRHGWELEVGAPVGKGIAGWDLLGRWRWAGLGNPVLAGEFRQQTVAQGRVLVLSNQPVEDGRELLVVARERSAAVQLDVVRPGLRGGRSVAFDLRGIRQDRSFLTPDGDRTVQGPLPAARRDFVQGAVTVGWSGIRRYPLGATSRDGWAAVARVRSRRHMARPDTGRNASFRDAVAILQGAVPVGDEGVTGEPGSAPVLAVRVAGGIAGGPGAGGSHFLVGGTGNRLLPVRGVAVGTAGGRVGWGGSLELRTPLARLHRGFGTLPLHLDQLAGGLFVDWAGAGSDNRIRHAASAGAELVLHQTTLFHGTEAVRIGAAVPLTGGGGLAWHFALGWAF